MEVVPDKSPPTDGVWKLIFLFPSVVNTWLAVPSGKFNSTTQIVFGPIKPVSNDNTPAPLVVNTWLTVPSDTASSLIPTTPVLICALDVVPDKSPPTVICSCDGSINKILPEPSVSRICPVVGFPLEIFNWAILTESKTLIISALARGIPVALLTSTGRNPSCTLIVLSVRSTVISPCWPSKPICSVEVPLLICTILAILFS